MVSDPLNHEQRDAWLKRLCDGDTLDRRQLGADESSLLAALADWGVSYRQTDQHIALDSDLELIDVQQIQTQLASVFGDRFKCHHRLVTRSTNSDAIDFFQQNMQPCIALAEMQTAGKGRGGKQWVSPFARNIYCTIGMLKSIQAGTLGLLSIVTGIALCRALERCGVGGVQLKWPNDLYYQRQKLGGILIESRPENSEEYFVAIGFGINIMMCADDLAVISQAATSINMINSDAVRRDTILLESIKQVVTKIDTFDESAIPSLIDEFNAHDALRGQRICATTNEQTVHGINAGINYSGQLQLDSEQGRLTFSAAEISLRGTD